jgi:hypothetical protein
VSDCADQELDLATPVAGCIQVVIGLAAVLVIVWQFSMYTLFGLDSFWVVTTLIVAAAFPLAIVTHEAGHAASALLMGFTITRLQMFTLSLERDGAGCPWRLRYGPNATMGSVTSVPRDTANLRRRFALLVAAGPGVAFLVALGCLTVAQHFHPDPPTFLGRPVSWLGGAGFFFPTTWPAFALNVFAVFNLMFTAMTLYPCVESGFPSDGEHLRRLRHSEYEVDLAMGWLGGMMQAGTRPRDWRPDLAAFLDRPAHVEKTMALLYAYYLAEDTGDVELAGRKLGQTISQLQTHPIGRPSSVYVEAAYFAAFRRADLNAGRAFLKRVPDGEQEEHTFLRAEAAVLFAGGDFAGAANKARAGIEAAARSRDPGGAKAERDWLLGVLAASLERLATPEETRS